MVPLIKGYAVTMNDEGHIGSHINLFLRAYLYSQVRPIWLILCLNKDFRIMAYSDIELS